VTKLNLSVADVSPRVDDVLEAWCFEATTVY